MEVWNKEVTIGQREEEEDGEFCVKTNRTCYGPCKLVSSRFSLCHFILFHLVLCTEVNK